MEYKCLVLIFLVFVCQIQLSKSEKVKITRQVSLHTYHCDVPECHSKGYKIFHFVANINKTLDSVHYLVSTLDKPVVIIAHTRVVTKITINWKNILKKSKNGIIFSPPANVTGAIALTKLFEYEDNADTVSLVDSKNRVIQEILSNFTWNSGSVSPGNTTINFEARRKNSSEMLQFEMKIFNNHGYDTELPHEPYNSNSSRFTLSIDNLDVVTKKSRFGVEVMVQNDLGAKQKVPHFNTKQSIDDEHSPGVFRLIQLFVSNSDSGVFASWKPVAYNDAKRTRSSQIFTYSFPSHDSSLDLVKKPMWTLADSLMHKTGSYGVNLTFGLSGDEFYNKTRYVGWTGIVGYGTPPQDEISLLVILVISVGLGLPVVLMLFGGIGICCRKILKRRRMQYQQIN